MDYVRVAKRKFHYIYKTTCLVTNRYYIGMHSTDDLNDGYIGSGKRLRYSIGKHGLGNHIVEILEFFESRTELALKEAELVKVETLTDPLCMNLKYGGEGGQSSEVAKRNWANPEYRAKLSAYHTERAMRPEVRARSSEWMKQLIADGKSGNIQNYYDWTGKTHTQETKDKMSETAKARMADPTKNSQYGTCWITHSEYGNKKIKKCDLADYESDGWVRGRKI